MRVAIRVITVSHQDQSGVSLPGSRTDSACAVYVSVACV